MKITATQYAKTLFELTAGKSQAEVDGVGANFVKTLAKNNQMKLAPTIMEKFSELWNKDKGIVEAEIISREKLGGEVVKKLENFVKEKYQAREVVLHSKIDSDIKGGFILKVGDEMIDGSVARKLRVLKSSLEK
jgi:F-type H+-transporting ATPase subunit delta